ncbi:MAG: SDR family oxidoreductase [Sphaerobacter thermophilus]|uniref:SDR family oxidoreductase n=1 Tax=Sphaerobacter thermophilus TaxID=2057 RepID=UPI001FDEDD01|nr:SDR family oxidoreductase [Sphaerobacter thermophilus]
MIASAVRATESSAADTRTAVRRRCGAPASRNPRFFRCGGAHLSEHYKTAIKSAILRGRPGEPRDIANAVVMLASPLADFVTGTTLVVDGGSSAGRAHLRPTGD